MHSSPVRKELVLIGGGHAHVEVLRRFGMRPEPGLRLTLITRELHTPYSGMLPGLVSGHYSFDESHIDLAPLAQFARARLYHDEVVGIDLVHQRVECRARPSFGYDLLSIDCGSAPNLAVPGAAAHAVPVKPVSSFYARWEQVRTRLLASDAALTIGVVGGGAGGVELIMAIRARLAGERDAVSQRVGFQLVTSGGDILESHPERMRRRYRTLLDAAGVTVTTRFNVTRVEAGAVFDGSGRRIAVDELFWVTAATPPAWPAVSGLKTDADGFVEVDATLRSTSHSDVYAAGDVATVVAHPRPRAGVFAVRQGPPLADNLRRAFRGESLAPFTPQKRFLSIISSGERYAVASRGRWSAAGAWVWRWKDHIDRRFMRRYRDLPRMAPEPSDQGDVEETMRCGGCGAKIGADVLREALSVLAHTRREDVLLGVAEADDAAVVRVPPGHLAVHTVDAFRSFIDDPWTLGRVAAQHALNDIYAMGATPQTALAMVTLPYADNAPMQEDLAQILRGAVAVFEQADTILVGGHTGEGAELAVGFAINGHVEEHALVRKRGVQPRDRLILTQSLGSGVLFAAAMRGLARARWIDHALGEMTRSKAAAARCLIAHGVHAMTDVTGFGLAGHLLEMLDGQAATLHLAALPLYDGAAELAADKIRSTLHEENRRAEARVRAEHGAANAARFDLAFDPQTAGGLLGAVAAERAADCLAELHALGYRRAAIIGEVGAAEGRLICRD